MDPLLFRDPFRFYRWLLAIIVTVYATALTLQWLWGWYVWLAGSDKYISMLRRYIVVQGLRLRFRTFWGDVLICMLLCVAFVLLWHAQNIMDLIEATLINARPTPSNPDQRMLTGGSVAGDSITPASAPARQLQDLPKDELEHLADEYGIDASRYKTRPQLVAAIHERRQLIASLDRSAMLDVIRWARRPVPLNANKEQIAMEIARIRGMNFEGITPAGLVALARLRGVDVRDGSDVPRIIKAMRKQEGFLSRLNRKRRAFLGTMVSHMLGVDEPAKEYQFLPPSQGGEGPAASGDGGRGSIRDDIEEQGLIGGIAGRMKKSADAFLNQKLDEIESRIDRKLDEIDRRLGEWRDKEVANRLRILKITLWASVIVAAISLIYSYIRVYIFK